MDFLHCRHHPSQSRRTDDVAALQPPPALQMVIALGLVSRPYGGPTGTRYQASGQTKPHQTESRIIEHSPLLEVS